MDKILKGGLFTMLPTDDAVRHGSMCNIIQNALQKVEVYLTFDQAATILIELQQKLPEIFRKKK